MPKISINTKIPKKRIAVIDRDLCTKEECGYVCISVCPINKSKKECITIDNEGYPVISEELCIGCNICGVKCPYNAISIINLDYDFPRTVHSYGVNSFRIYTLALPRQGLIGFLGKNGIGKTTMLNILSKKLIPNFDKDVKTWEEAYKNMTVEEKAYFQDNKKFSVKPQYIETFRKNILVKDLLKSLNIDLEDKSLYEKKLIDLSGGELQKLIIEISLAIDADIYYIDEPTNFLDIAERLKYATRIREKLENKTAIIVDHDLAFLDYIVDFVYLFVGEEDVFGFNSSIKNTRNGINEYIEGYLKSENYRFRESIKFDSYSQEEIKSEILISYPKIEKTIDNFRLEVEPGEIRKGEIIGVVGRNGIGKSTFFNTLFKQGFKAYKPQYLPVTNELVKDLNIKSNILASLDIKQSLLEKPLSKLSGGQLQKVHIAKTLSIESDVYILDEPTAYLDIENRIKLASFLKDFVIKTGKSIMVIDHDIVFIDRVSSRIIAFKGEPGEYGIGSKPLEKIEGMNEFLKIIDVTIRRDLDTNRPRLNKPNSVLDREQKSSNKYYV